MQRLGILILTVLAVLAAADASPTKGRGKGRGRDSAPPTLVCPSGITVDAMAPMGAYVAYTVTVTDDTDPSPDVTYSHPSGSTFPVGTTTVTVTATDWRGNSSTGTFDITVAAVAAFSYGMEWLAWDLESSDYVVWYAWSITVDADGNISGSAVQNHLLISYWVYGEEYAVPMPEDLIGSGSMSGTMSSDGTTELEQSNNGWYLDAYDYDDPGILTEWTSAFSGTTQATLDANGNLIFNGAGGYYGIWYRN